MRFLAQIRRGVGILCRMEQASDLSSSATSRQLHATTARGLRRVPLVAGFKTCLMAVVMAGGVAMLVGCSSGARRRGHRRRSGGWCG